MQPLISQALPPLREITVEGLEMLFDDRRAGQVWTIRDGALELQQGQSGLEAELRFCP